MRILFNDLEEKEEFITRHAKFDEDEDDYIYRCPACKSEYNDIDDAMDCCVCSEDEALEDGKNFSSTDDDDDDY